MLLSYMIYNFESFAEEQNFSLVATKAIKNSGIKLLDVDDKFKALPSCVVYGANASGKSNLIKGLLFIQDAVLNSFRRDPDHGVPVSNFALDPKLETTPSEFSIDFIAGGIRYSYQFSCNKQEFLTESLYSYLKNQPRKLFERNGGEVSFGKNFQIGSVKYVKTTIGQRPNSLLLSALFPYNTEALKDVYCFFRDMNFISDKQFNPNKNYLPRIIEIFKQAEMGIVDYKIKKDPSTGKEYLFLGHRGVDGEVRFLDLEQESTGTLRLLQIMSDIIEALDEGRVILCDDITERLHSNLAKELVALFNNAESNPKGAQLITSTHNTALMNDLRRDQIYFVEKNHYGASSLYSLAEFKVRDNADFEQVEGRFGAIPSSGSFGHLLVENEDEKG